MRNTSGSGCCGGKSAKAEDKASKIEPDENRGCCGGGETPEPTAAEATAAATGASGSDATTERKGCC